MDSARGEIIGARLLVMEEFLQIIPLAYPECQYLPSSEYQIYQSVAHICHPKIVFEVPCQFFHQMRVH